MADPGAVAGGTAAAAAAGGGHGLLIVLIIIILAIVVGAAAYFFVLAPSSSSGLNGTGSVSPEVQAILPANQSKSFSGVFTGIAQNIATNDQQFTIIYQGAVSIGVSVLSFSVPLNVTYERYAPDSRLQINGTKVPVIGNFSDVYVNQNGTKYDCSKISLLQNATNTTSGASGQAAGYRCLQLSVMGNIFSALQNSNTSSASTVTGGALSNSTFNISLHSVGTRYYNSMPCLLVVGSGSSTVKSTSGSQVNSTYQLDMCLSGSYSVPLNFSYVATSSSGVSATHYTVNLNEVFIGQPLTQAQVSSLPGPLVNTTNSTI